MNILEQINQQVVTLNQSDYLGELDIQLNYNNISKILDYYENLSSYDIKTFDNYIDFLYLWKQTKYLNAFPFIREEIKDEFEKNYEKLSLFFKCYDKKSVISFINNNYSNIFDNQIIANMTFKFISDKQKGINKNVFIELAKKHPWIWYSNIKDQIKYLKNNIDIVTILFTKENINIYIIAMYDLLFNSLIELQKYEQFDYIFKQSILVITEYMDNLENSVSQNNIFNIVFIYQDFCKFLKNINSTQYLQRKKKLSELIELWYEEIKKTGLHFSHTLNIEILESKINQIPPKILIIYFTHIFDEKTKHLVPILQQLFNNNDELGLENIFKNFEPSNNFFTSSKIDELKVIQFAQTSFLHLYLHKPERQQDFFYIIKNFIKNICKQLNIDLCESGLFDGLNILEVAIYNLFQACNDIRNASVIQMLCYTIITYGCSYIEKLLREICIAQNKEMSSKDLKDLTLGNIIKDNPQYYTICFELLGVEQTKCLRYYLHLDDNEVGKNIRNKFAHLRDITPKDYSPETAMLVLWLLLGVINSIYLHYFLEKSNEKS